MTAVEALGIARNEIYARHGNKFDNQEYQRHFGQFDWYNPTHKVSDSELNAIEKANLETLLAWEEAAKSSGSSQDGTGNGGGGAQTVSGGLLFPDSDTRYLNESDLQAILASSSSTDDAKTLLGVARNEIYARHGNIFDSDKYREYFGQFSWYNPTHKVQDSELNEVEKANVQTLLGWEQNL